MHAPIIKLMGKGIDRIGFTGHFSIDFLIMSIAAIPVILLISFAFFALVERPCMERNWHLHLYHKIWRADTDKLIEKNSQGVKQI
jgi:peptidoglycan/LPS O-acetylase OafA/YrhL